MTNKVTQDQVVETALTLLDQNGLTNVTLKQVAAQLNIKPPSLYTHIKNLTELRALMAQVALTNLNTQLTQAVIGLSGRSAIQAAAMAYRDFFQRHPGQAELTQQVTSWANAPVAIATSDQIVGLLTTIVQQAGLAVPNDINYVRALRSFLYGFSTLERQNGFQLDESMDASFKFGLNLLLAELPE
ncbi:Transcriptional regulator [Lactobacillus paracasei ATCC 334] [Lactiplantibacillus mudanjiangensis]|uniref:TetR/AcrR family transcriptional regulator n=1 Tax=Lactiplantibacillus mudanjiangensis TaxID=1296538 RepID=UPI00101451BD|nr:TetR-like C-terminal domain-containing protein [Lactiplantibacillus mudanjiangensis]VDG31102.1 Transcriptional regulator [Lactobacillus paracasei ATCC 334] [Lactiplantibacillus mudanjiangensis]